MMVVFPLHVALCQEPWVGASASQGHGRDHTEMAIFREKPLWRKIDEINSGLKMPDWCWYRQESYIDLF